MLSQNQRQPGFWPGCLWLRGQDLNLRPSGYEPDELPGCSTPREGDVCCEFPIGGAGGDLLSRVLRRSTIGAEGFHGRVRDGIGCCILAMTASPSNRKLVLGLGREGSYVFGWFEKELGIA